MKRKRRGIGRRVKINALAPKRRYPVSNKWLKTKVLERDRTLRAHLPATKLLNNKSLSDMLNQYGMVYVKPVIGSLGRGVMKVEKNQGSYAFQLKSIRRQFSSFNAMLSALMLSTGGQSYLVQKGIRLLKHRGRPFDIRLMVQRAPKGGWAATGTVGRVAHPSKIVTNGSQGGTIYPTVRLLNAHGNAKKVTNALKLMETMGKKTARKLHAAYPVIREIGIDYALDSRLKPWILEVNTSPDPCPFALLEDQSMLRKIVRYAKGYGRRYRLRCVKAKRGR